VSASAAARYDRTIIRWGQGPEMTAYEAALWHISDRATLRAASVVVELLDLTPDWQRFRNGHAWALGRVPRLRQRVVSDPVRLGPPAWADTEVDLDHHLSRVQLAPRAGLEQALAVASAMHELTFDPERPLWQASLVEGLPRGRAAYVLKFHHAMADDQALVSLFELLHSYVRVPTVSTPQLPPARHEACTPGELSRRHAFRAMARTPLAVARLAAGTMRTGAVAVRDPAGSVGRSVAAGRSVARELASVREEGSPLLRQRGPHRAFHAIELPSEQLRAAGAAAGGRAGDVALAATVEGLARYHRELGMPVTDLPVAVPLHLRLDGSGDRLPRGRILVSTAPMTLAQRISLTRRLIAAAEELPRIDVLRIAAPVISRTPTPVAGRLMERSMRELAATGFVVPGLNRDAYLAGAQVLRMFSFAPTSGCALSMTLVTHQESSCMGFNADTTAIERPEILWRCLGEAFAEAAGNGASAVNGGDPDAETEAG
jgi:diacylglycerol O-acyltransferase